MEPGEKMASQSETFPPEYLQMYEISGQDKITEHSFDRYIKDKEQEQAIENTVKQPITYPLIKKIESAPESERSSLIKQGLIDQDIELRKECVNTIGLAPEKERADLIKLGLQNPNIEVQIYAIWTFSSAPEKEWASLIKFGLENNNIEIQKEALRFVTWLSAKEQVDFEEIILKKIKEWLNSDDEGVQKEASKIILKTQKEERVELNKILLEKIITGLNDSSLEIQKKTARIIGYIPNENRQEIFHLIIEKGLGEEFIESPLYNRKNINNNTFSRQEFNKTGSKTTLIGGDLKNKTIIRHIGIPEFLNWKKLFENYKYWKELGFDYVPIEPIQSFRLNKEGLVDVSSGVLDLNLKEWLQKSPKFIVELMRQRNNIIAGLDTLKIRHGHTHDENFCLRFFRDENGKIDFTRTPRLYLIDFDQANS